MITIPDQPHTANNQITNIVLFLLKLTLFLQLF